MLKLIRQNIEFKKDKCRIPGSNCHRTQVKINADAKMYIPADKTTNYYRLNTDSYNQLINTAITKSYKKAPSSAPNQIISEEKKIATGLNLQNRIDALPSKNVFITWKGHKPNFQNKPTCRLINPTKSEIGIVSKEILQRINAKTVAATNLNQWKNTNAVLTWFKNVPNKQA